MAVASYDWLAAMGLAIVAMFILPRILRSGVYTMPEYLEYRYSPAAQNLMSCYMVGIYSLVTIPAVLYTGGLAIHTMFDLNLTGRGLDRGDDGSSLHHVWRFESGGVGRLVPRDRTTPVPSRFP